MTNEPYKHYEIIRANGEHKIEVTTHLKPGAGEYPDVKLRKEGVSIFWSSETRWILIPWSAIIELRTSAPGDDWS